jgi:O-antigen ligase
VPRLILFRQVFSLEAPRKGRFSWVALFSALGAGAFVAAWLAPNHYPPWTSFHGEVAAFAGLIALCCAALSAKKPILFDRALLIFLFLLGIICVQWGLGQVAYGGDAIVSGLYLVGFALAWWLGTNLALTERRINDAAMILLVGATVSVFIAMLQWLRIEATLGIFAADLERGMRPFGNLGQPNHLATLALMGIVSASALYFDNQLKKWQWVLLVAFLTFGLILTQSRAGLLSAVALGAFFLLYSRRLWRPGSWKFIAAWWIVLMVLVNSWVPLNEALYLQPARDQLTAEDRPRVIMWKQMVAALEQSPWVGYGWRQTVVAQKKGADKVEGTLPTDYAHNLPLDLLVWLGIPLGGLLILLISYWLFKAAQRIKTSTEFFLLAAVVPVGIHSSLEFPFAYAYFLFPVGWLLGTLNAQQHPEISERRGQFRKFLQPGMAAFVLVFAGMCSWLTFEYLKVEEDYQVMRFEMRRVGVAPANYSPPQLTLLTQFDEVLTVGRMVPSVGMRPQDLSRMGIASNNLSWATLQLNYAVALGLNGQGEEATRQLQNLRNVYGVRSYEQALEVFIDLKNSKYPQLVSVQLP